MLATRRYPPAWFSQSSCHIQGANVSATVQLTTQVCHARGYRVEKRGRSELQARLPSRLVVMALMVVADQETLSDAERSLVVIHLPALKEHASCRKNMAGPA